MQLKAVLSKYEDAKKAVGTVGDDDSAAKEILVPLTESVYIPGKVKNPNKILCDVGTGYYIERVSSSLF